MSNIDKVLYFSLFSGEIYSIPKSDDKNIDAFQIPLKGLPNKSCKKCYGRLHTGYNLTHKHYHVCHKCLKRILDVDRLYAKNNK